ncbi:MAG: capsid cement protein [Myxococcota bacterium]
MGTKFVQPGDTITLTAPSGGVTVNVPIVIGNGLLVIPLRTASAGATFEAIPANGGPVVTLPADNADTFNEGEPVYWDDGNSRVTVVAGTTALHVGWAVENSATPTEVDVLLCQTVVDAAP